MADGIPLHILLSAFVFTALAVVFGIIAIPKEKRKKEAIANNRLLDGIIWWIKPESNFHVYNSTEVRRSKPTLWIISLLMLIEAVQPLRLSISQENRGCKWAALNKQGETS